MDVLLVPICFVLPFSSLVLNLLHPNFFPTYTAICGTESVTLNHFVTNSQSGIFKAAPCLPIMMYCETISICCYFVSSCHFCSISSSFSDSYIIVQ